MEAENYVESKCSWRTNLSIKCYYKDKKVCLLTKYVVGANANPPKNERSPPKNGKQIPRNIVVAAYDSIT